MKRNYAVIELRDDLTFDPSSDEDHDAVAEDLLAVTHGIASVVVYSAFEELQADEGAV